MTEINCLYDTIQERIITSDKKLPVRPFIIGKTTAIEETDKLENSDFEIELRKISTYVLENLPLGLDNKSITNDFTYDVRGKANLFVDYRSKYNYKPEEIVESRPVLYQLKGNTKVKLEIKLKDENNNFSFVLSEGDFDVNFPYAKQGKIEDLLSIEMIKNATIEVNSQ